MATQAAEYSTFLNVQLLLPHQAEVMVDMWMSGLGHVFPFSFYFLQAAAFSLVIGTPPGAVTNSCAGCCCHLILVDRIPVSDEQ